MRLSLLLLALLPAANVVFADAKADADAGDFLYFFHNVAVADNRFTFEPQVRLAKEAGLGKFIFNSSRFPLVADPKPADWAATDDLLGFFENMGPGVTVAPRISLMTNVGDAGLTQDSAIVYKKGPSRILSWTDPAVQEAAVKAIHSVVTHCEASPFADHIWGYQFSGRETGEWIPDGYRVHGPDYSDTNRRAFQRWLKARYTTDETLQAAWGDATVMLDNAEVPVDKDERFPVIPPKPGRIIKAFYDLPAEQNWVDYSEFVSDENAGNLLRLAAEVKSASAGKKAAITFYGYVFELPGSICGHLKTGMLLRNSEVDFFAAPISYAPYAQRLSSGPGAAMGAVDSFPLHGKIWVNEDDLHTHVKLKDATVPKWYWDSSKPDFKIPANAAETTGILSRNLAFSAFHQGATWWMDLYGGGWFTDPKIWNLWSGDFGKKMRAVRSERTRYSPSVAVIVDEESRLYEKFTWTFKEMYPPLRNACNASGATVGFYYLDDYLDGLVPPTAATVFVNAWRLDPEREQTLKKRLHERGGVVVWQYAPGFLNAGSDGIFFLTGIHTRHDDGMTGSHGTGPLDKITFGGTVRLDPRIIIDDPDTTPLSLYNQDGTVSGAVKTVDGITHVLIADHGWNAGLVHQLLRLTQVPLVTDTPSVTFANAKELFVYATQDGPVTITAPAGTRFTNGDTSCTVTVQRNANHLLSLEPAAAP
ncbi:MAG: beta-galactosidase [Opitutaceae bacterium]|jgi:hypothetical protein